MSDKTGNEKRKEEGDVHKGLPEAAPASGNPYEEDDHPATDNPNQHGEMPRHRDDSEDDKSDPYKKA